MAVLQKPRVKGMYSNKVGLMYPSSPRGIASLMDLNTEPDLTICSDSFRIGWETDPAVIREYVPEPLEVDGSGRIYLLTSIRWGYTSRNSKEFISAERLTRSEAFFMIPCTYKGERYLFTPFSWGNRDWLRVAGHQIGLYHKWAKVQMTQFHPFHPTWNGPHEGARICVTVENIGLVLRAYADLKRVVPVEELPSPFRKETHYGPKLVGHRYFWDSCKGKPALNDLVVHLGDNSELGPIWSGDASIQFYDAENEEVMQFQPKRMIGAWWFNLRYNHAGTPPYVIHDYGDANPYASRPRIRELLEARSQLD